MNRAEFGQIMEFLSGSRPDQRTALSEATMKVYWLCLQDIPFDVAKAAVLQHLTSNKWFPSVAELREMAAKMTPNGNLPAALDAWGEIKRAIAVVGSYGDPANPISPLMAADGTLVTRAWPGWAHPIIERVVNAMGWQSLCLSENEVADRAHFLKLYETIAARWKFDNEQLPEVRALRARLAEQQLPAPVLKPALPAPAEAAHSVATALATLANRMAAAEQPEPEPESERLARLEAKRRDALMYLAERA